MDRSAFCSKALCLAFFCPEFSAKLEHFIDQMETSTVYENVTKQREGNSCFNETEITLAEMRDHHWDIVE